MMYNYHNSVAQRNIKFSSGITVTEVDSSVDPSNSVVLYIPSYLASANILSYSGTALTPSVPIVKTVTADNYTDVLTGELLSQWAAIFNEGANIDVTLYLVVFYCTLTDFGTYLTVAAKTINFSPLTTAFNLTYHIGYLKQLFSEHYNGTSSTVEGSEYDDSHYFDLALCLAYLVNNETKLSANVAYVKLDLTTSGTNECVIHTATKAAEETAMVSLSATISGITNPRNVYFWGALYLVASGSRNYVCVHSESTNYIPVVLKYFYKTKNASGIYVGNEIDFFRLSDSTIKPTGTVSILNEEVNDNMSDTMTAILDAKNVGYLYSIEASTANNAVLSQLVSVADAVPFMAPMISKYVDYHAAQDVAKWLTAQEAVTDPVLKSQLAYKEVQSILTAYLNKFVAINVLNTVALNFPAYSTQTSKSAFTISNGWTADFVYRLRNIALSGNVTV